MRLPWVLLCAVPILCTSRYELMAQNGPDDHRIFFRGTWEREDHNPGLINPNGRPELQVAGVHAVYVYDYATHELRALDGSGNLLWATWGADGPAPVIGFANPSDMKVDKANNLWIDDPYAGLVFVLSERGVVQRRIPALQSAARIVLQPDGGFWLWDEAIRGGGFSIFSASGVRIGEIPARDRGAGIDTLPPIVRVPWLARGADPASPIVQTFSWSSDFLLWNQADRKPLTIHGVEPLNFPVALSWSVRGRDHLRVPPDASRGAMGAVADDSRIYILFAGATKYKGRIVDTYRLHDGVYVGSYLLPQPVVSLSRLGESFVTTTTQPMAGVQIWKWVQTSKNARGR